MKIFISMGTNSKEYIKLYREKNKEKIKEQVKLYNEKNKDKIKEYNDKYIQLYREKNKEKIKELTQTYYEKNKEKIKEQVKLYNEKNKDKIKERQKLYREKNKEKIKERQKLYREKNKEKIQKRISNYIKERKKNDSLFKLKHNTKILINNIIKNRGFIKKNKTHEIIGCSYEDFKKHIESKFESWMSWDNYGKYNGTEKYGWDIDHIIPISSAITENDIIKLNHYTNLQPLCSFI